MKIFGYLERAYLEQLASAPASPIQGRIYYDTGVLGVRVYASATFVTLADLTTSQVLTNKDIDGGTASNTSRLTLPSAALAALTALTRKAGTIVYASDLGKPYFDNGTTLTAIGSGGAAGGGSKNYLGTVNGINGNGDFELAATTGWSLFSTTLTSLIPTGAISAGAASITTFAATTTGKLAGTNSLSIAGSGVISAGQGFISDAVTLDLEDQGKVLTGKFAYQAVSGTFNFSGTSSNTWAIYAYDVTNSRWLQPAGVYAMIQGSGVGLASASFQPDTTCTQVRFAVLCINATGAASSMLFDDFTLSPNISGTIAPKAPTVTKYTSGSGTYTPPSEVTYLRVRMVGGGGGGAGGGASYVAANNGTASTFGPATAGGGSGSPGSVGGAGGSASLGSGPIGTAVVGTYGGGEQNNSGSSTAALAGGSGGNAPFFSGGGVSEQGANVGRGGTANTGGGGAGGPCTIAANSVAGGGGGSGGAIDAIISPAASYSYSVGTGGAGSTGTVSVGGTGAAGYIEITEYYSGSGSSSTDGDGRVIVGRFSVPTSTPNNGPITWGTVEFDTTGSYNPTTGQFKVPVSGYYDVGACLVFTGGTSNYLSVYINGVESGRIVAASASINGQEGTLLIKANAGDLVDIRGNGSITGAPGGNTYSYMWVAKRSGSASGSASAVYAPSVQRYVAGGTYTVPSSPKTPLYIRVKCLGAGGGGAGSATNAGANGGSGGTGGNSTFGPNITSGGGSGSAWGTSVNGGAGGTPVITTSSSLIQVVAVPGGQGGPNVDELLGTYAVGGDGGNSYFGCGASGGSSVNAGGTAAANTGAGGGGAGSTQGAASSGAGGGAGAYIEAILTSLTPGGTFGVTVGTGGIGGPQGSGGAAGGAGGSGIVIIEEYYQ